MNTKKYLFFVEKKYTERDKNRWGIKELTNDGYQVDIVNINSLVHPRSIEEQSVCELFRPSSFRELDNYMSKIELDTKVVFTSINSIRFLPIIKLCNKYGFITIVLQLGPVPKLHSEGRKLSIINIANLMKVISMHVIKKLCNPYINYFVKGGNKTSILPMYSVGKEIKAHSMDYQKCQEITNVLVDVPTNYVLFLDQNLMGHPDDRINGFKFEHLSDDYFRKINSFFDYVESKFEMEVVIAAHPSSDLQLLKHNFNYRVAYSGALEFLAKESTMILSHASTSMGVAAIYTKPLVLLDCEELRVIEKTYQKYTQSAFSSMLDVYILTIDSETDYKKLAKIPDINLDRYKEYTYNYLNCSPSKHGSIWDKIKVDLVN